MTRIHVHYQELGAAARKFDGEAQEMQAWRFALRQRCEQLTAAWEGAAEDEFVRQLQNCTERMQRTPLALGQLTRDVNKAAYLLEMGERQARTAILTIVSADD
ncbi:MAG: WXG100 family type VII secretion target [Chloroflexi bacterium]|nr:WXG100 family type VII secretion target [Chloroflexota bacterium]